MSQVVNVQRGGLHSQYARSVAQLPVGGSDAVPEKLVQDQAIWLKHRQTSPAWLVHALRFQCPVWDHRSWIPSEFGLNPMRFDDDGKPRMPGYIHYQEYDPKENEDGLLSYFSLLGLATTPDPDIARIPCCGSKNCVTPVIVGQMIEALADLIQAASGSLPTDYLELVSLTNAIAALARVVELLLAFRRNYPGDSPFVLNTAAGIRVPREVTIAEKVRPRQIVYGPVLTTMLEEVGLLFLRVIDQLDTSGYSVIHADGAPQFAYGFLPLRPWRREIRLQGPSKSRIVEGLAHHAATERFAGLAGNAMRNFSYYILGTDPDLSVAALALHDHVIGCGGKKGRGYAGAGAHRETAIAAEGKILNQLGFNGIRG